MSTNHNTPTNDKFLDLERPITFFDLETTGVNINSDRIVEIFALRLEPDGTNTELHHIINPTIPIPEEASAIHGITNEMVADKPTFLDLIDEIAAFFQDTDISGFNIKRFDLPLLMQEFHRFKKYPITFTNVKIVDVCSLYHAKEKRDLASAVKFYCNAEHNEAHSARADVLATVDVLKQQLKLYSDLVPHTDFLHTYLTTGNNVDLNGKFIKNNEGEILFNFGKHNGKPAKTELDYLLWMVKEGDFSIDTKMVASSVIKSVRMKS